MTQVSAFRASFTEAEILTIFRREVNLLGGPKAWGNAHGICKQRVWNVINDRMRIQPDMLEALGYRRVVTYQPIPKDNTRDQTCRSDPAPRSRSQGDTLSPPAGE